MKYINEIREGEQIIEHYLCKSRQTFKSKNDKNYLSLKLADKTGTVDAKVWNLGNDIQSFAENDMIKIDATAQIFNNDIQLNVKRIRKSREGEYDPADYIPSTDKDIKEMWGELTAYIDTFKNQHIKELLNKILVKNGFVAKEFPIHSAAKSVHHGYLGGLLEHTLSVTKICDFMADKYKFVDRDVLVASAMLHDVGKLWELSDFPLNDYTDDGQFLGHIVMGSEMVGEKIRAIPGFPTVLEAQLKHCILAHHGEYEYGSPKKPAIMEAMALNLADNADAKLETFTEILEGTTEQGWLGYNRLFESNLRGTRME